MLKRIETTEKLKEVFGALYKGGVFDAQWVVEAVVCKFILDGGDCGEGSA